MAYAVSLSVRPLWEIKTWVGYINLCDHSGILVNKVNNILRCVGEL